MDKIEIQGGRRLAGRVRISGAKNAALPILVSALLTDGWNTFTNVPDLMDIRSTRALLENHGAVVERDGAAVRINAGGLNNFEAPYDLVRKMRASILVLGPLVARMKRARVSLPGGCAIGARPINLHLKGLERLGAAIELHHGYVEASAERLTGADIYFDTVTVTGTENLMMAAVLAQGRTELRNAAREPEIVALAEVLNTMGADVQGAGTPVITINGVDALHPTEAEIIPDRIETGTFLVAAALTGGDVRIEGCAPDHVGATLNKLAQAGVDITAGADHLHVQADGTVRSVDVRTEPYPGFPTDMQAQFMVLMAVARGDQHDQRNHFREPVHPCQRAQADGRRHSHQRQYRHGARRREPFRRAGHGLGSAGQRLPDPGRAGGRRDDPGQPGLPPRPRL